MFDGQYDDQIDGVATGLVLANIFMFDFEGKKGAPPTIWFRYVDDT